MEVEFSDTAETQLQYWKNTGNKQILIKIRKLVESIAEDPFRGIGKPEPLKHNFTGYWSRRISGEHRLVYTIKGDKILIVQCRFHYL